MATRLSDTDKWKNPWFRSIPAVYKLLFLYMLDTCDNAGILHLDLELFSFLLKENFTIQEIQTHFAKQIVFLSEDKIIIRNFVRHQRNENNEMIKRNVMKSLEKHGVLKRYMDGEFG